MSNIHPVFENIINGIAPKEASLFTEDDLDNCWSHYKAYLIDILNGDYDLDIAREDLRGLIGSRFDKRINNEP